MNGKRQTIWLVSMLSLMVVLSAYYLFTEDSGMSAPETAGSIQVEGNVKDTASVTLPAVGNEGVVVNEVVIEEVTEGKTAEVVTPEVLADTGVETSDTGNNSTDPVEPVKETASVKDDKVSVKAEEPAIKDDAAILNEVASQSVSSSSLFTNYQYEREQKNIKDHNDLLSQITNMEKTPADNAIAQEQLRSLEEKESKINGIEEQLQLKYGEAIVKEENGNHFKVVVLSDKMDVKQAVGIVDLVMKELSITQDKISVQYVSE